MDRNAIGPGAVRVASAVPGRVRLQGDPARRATLADLAEELGTWPHVTAVDLRVRSASIVLRFAPEHLPAIADGLLELGIDLRSGSTADPSSPPEMIAAAASAGNRAVGQRLGGTDLRTLVPLGLGLLAARRAMRRDERLADAPWYVLAWYATETFWKFHGGAAGAREQAAVPASPPPA